MLVSVAKMLKMLRSRDKGKKRRKGACKMTRVYNKKYVLETGRRRRDAAAM